MKNSVEWSYFDRFGSIEDKYLETRGEGNTKASQAVTAVTKLIYKWYNDGDVYDNTYNLQGWCNDLSTYANWLAKYIPGCEEILENISVAYSEADYENILKDLADLVLDFDFLKQYEVEKVDSIYECKGEFKFEYINDEDDDWEDEWPDEEDEDEYYEDEDDEE